MSERLAGTPLAGTRIAVVNNFAGPGMGGGEVAMLRVVRGLVEAGARVAVFAPQGSTFGEQCQAAGATFEPAALSARHTPSFVAQLRRWAGSQPALLVGTGYFTNILVRMAARGTGATAVNVVGVVPGASVHEGASGAVLAARRFAERATRSRVGAFIAVSDAVARTLLDDGVTPDRLHVVLNGVDVEDLARRAQQPAEGLPPTPRVVCVARLAPVKGVDVLIRAAELIDDVNVAIVGEGPEEGRLRELALAMGVTSRLVFLRADAAAAMAAADIVVVPSRSEAFGLVAAEAMALGVPVVASNVGGLPEVVDDGVTGVLVPPSDPEALAEAIRTLLADPERMQAMGQAGRSRVAERFSAARMVDGYVAVLSGLVRDQSSS